MFEQSILESSQHFEIRRGCSALTAAGLQISLLAFMALVPLLRPELLIAHLNEPQPILTAVHVINQQPSGPPPTGPVVQEDETTLREPGSIPVHVHTGRTEPVPPIFAGTDLCVSNCSPNTNLLTSIASAQPPKPPAPTIVHISHFDEGGLVARVQPQYPPLAKAARIQGSVVLNAIVGKDGSIQNLQVASGHPMLAEAAVRAVSQWKFRPYILDGSPVEVATQITVHFTLANE